MKTKNNRFFYVLLAISFVSMFMASCKHDESIQLLHLNVAQFNQRGKVYMDVNMPRWTEGDVININNVACTLHVSGNDVEHSYATTVVERSSNYKAIFPHDCTISEMDGSVVGMSLPEVQPYVTDASHNNAQVLYAPMCAQSTGNSLVFKNMGAVLAINIDNSRDNDMVVDYVSITSINNSVALWGDAQVFDFASAPYYQCVSDVATHNTVYLKDDDGWDLFALNSGDSKIVYIYIPSVPTEVLNKFSVTVYTHSGHNAYNYTLTQQTPGLGNFLNNELVDVPFSTSEATQTLDPDRTSQLLVNVEGAIPDAMFEINVDGDQVYFSKGNLQYCASLNEWRFAEHQYDYVGNVSEGNVYENGVKCNNADIDVNYSGWIDLFGWGTSGYDNTTNDGYASRFMPYESADGTINTTYNYYGYGPSINMSNPHIAGSNYDWGVNNQINDAGERGSWRTLTYDEWKYLLNTREVQGGSGKGYSWQLVYVNSIRGMLIYADSYNGTLYAQNAALNAVPELCAFLPCAGERKKTTINYPGTLLGYWTATNYYMSAGVGTANKTQSVRVSVSSSSSNITWSKTNRCIGSSVRLVQDID